MAALAAPPPDRLLAGDGHYIVRLLYGDAFPLLLHELSRRREGAFRAQGEGHGRSRHMDRYDVRYEHLLLEQINFEKECFL